LSQDDLLFGQDSFPKQRFDGVVLDQIDFAIQDPKALVKPWNATFYTELRPKWELGEISCSGDYLEFKSFEK